MAYRHDRRFIAWLMQRNRRRRDAALNPQKPVPPVNNTP